MSKHNQLPSSVRKIRATVRNYTAPFVWGSLAVITIFTLLLWEFSRNPERFYLFNTEDSELLAGEEEPDPSTLSTEDSMIAADIDSSDVLLNDLKQMEPPPVEAVPRNITPGMQSNRSTRQQQSDQKKQPSPNLLLRDAQDNDPQSQGVSLLPDLPALPSFNPTTGIADPTSDTQIATPPGAIDNQGMYGLNGNTFATPDLGELPVSPLQAAMDRIYSSDTSTGDSRRERVASSGNSRTPNARNDGSTNEKAQNPAASQPARESQSNPSARVSQPESNPDATQTAPNPYNTPQNSANPYANPTAPNPYNTPQNPANPYATQTAPNPYNIPQNSANPYATQTAPNPYNIPQNSGNPYALPGAILNNRNLQQNPPPNSAIAPTLPGEISPYGIHYGINYSTNSSPFSGRNPNTGLSNPANAYEYLLRSQPGMTAPTLLPGVPEAAPMQPLDLGQPAYQTPNPYNNPYNSQTPVQPTSGSTNLTPNLRQQRSTTAPTSEIPPSAGDRSLNPAINRLSTPSSVPSNAGNPGISSGINPNVQNQGVQPIQPTQPFSVPSRVPGRYIGGGEINTFSNP